MAILLGEQAINYGIFASLVAASISAAGIFAMSLGNEWAKNNAPYFSAFAVGLITVSVAFHLIPEAVIMSEYALSWVAAGFAIMVLLGIGVQAAVNRQPNGAALTFGYASVIALAAHSFLDGAIYAASFHRDEFTGWLATAGLILHEFPEGIIAYALLRHAGISNVNSVILSLIAAGATTVAGTLFAIFLILFVGGIPIPAMLGGASGALIYVLIVHLGPHAASAPKRRGYDAASLGVVVGTAAVVIEHLGRHSL